MQIENRFVDMPVGVIRPGDMFGEVALINDSKRSATCQTASKYYIVVLVFPLKKTSQ